MTGELAEYMAGVFAWSIDFFRLHPGDEFKVIYNEKSVEGTPYAIGGIRSVWFKHQGREFYAFRYALDAEGKQMGTKLKPKSNPEAILTQNSLKPEKNYFSNRTQ